MFWKGDKMNTCVLWNDGWRFSLFPYRTEYTQMKAAKKAAFLCVCLPHDWQIEDVSDLYADGSGWYIKTFDYEPEADNVVALRFEGVYMDSEIYVNGVLAFTWKYGYSTFEADITQYLRAGRNEIAVGVHVISPNTRWYSGSGIYRNVWLKTYPKAHILPDGIYVSAKPCPKTQMNECAAAADGNANADAPYTCDYEVNVCVECSGVGNDYSVCAAIYPDFPSESQTAAGGEQITLTVSDGEKIALNDFGSEKIALTDSGGENGDRKCSDINGSVENDDSESCDIIEPIEKGNSECRDINGSVECDVKNLYADYENRDLSLTRALRGSFILNNPRIWDPKDPALYHLEVSLVSPEGVTLQKETVQFGCRSLEFSPENGLSLNGRKIKLQGVCLHHDLGCLGSAFHKDAARRQLLLMRRLGANAIRTSHNMPAPELLQLTDELGFLVVDEAFDMWREVKTTYDYARFFDEWQKRDVTSWIIRDRNHPSVIMWSVGNEIHDMHAGKEGEDIVRMLKEEVERLDPYKNARVTFGSNYMPWEGAQNCADVVKIPGYNYGEKCYDAHHEKHPDWIIYGSETASTVQSRGIYKFPLSVSQLCDVDEQCSGLGNCTTSWGAPNSEFCLAAELDHPYSLGQFIWSGTDYIGEPTPYHTRNSYFGQLDTAGFFKDTASFYMAGWKDEPMMHLFPYWNFNPGQIVDVRVVTNCAYAELWVNGKSLGRKAVRTSDAPSARWSADYRVPFEKGMIEACVYDENGTELLRETRQSFGNPNAIAMDVYDGYMNACVPEESVCYKDGMMTAYTFSGMKKGLYFVEISTTDSNGCCVENANNRIAVSVSGDATLRGMDNGDSTDCDPYYTDNRRLFSGKLLAVIETTKDAAEFIVSAQEVLSIAAREIILTAGDSEKGIQLTPECDCIEVYVKIVPENAVLMPVEYTFSNETGIDIDFLQIEKIQGYLELSDEERSAGYAAKLRVRAKGDGHAYLRAFCRNGEKVAKVISSLDFEATGFGQLHFDPYEPVAGGLFNDCDGSVGNGNDHGAASMRDGRTLIGFKGVDFKKEGSDTMTLPIFELASEPVPIGVWIGHPDRGGRLLDTVVYHKESIWNTYQEETFVLPERIRGVVDLYFELHSKIHLKGFVFKKYERAYELLHGADADRVYGDQYTIEGNDIMGIGNNVTVQFDDLHFGNAGATKVRIFGHTANPKDTISLVYHKDGEQMRQVLEFVGEESVWDSSSSLDISSEMEAGGRFVCREFDLNPITGDTEIAFVFLPGAAFDLHSIQFC